jgi:molybdate/tungstate transport system substrate-binding protein
MMESVRTGRRNTPTGRRDTLSVLLAACLVCGLSLGPVSTVPARAAETVDVLYAGSLVNLMEHGIGPAFDQASGLSFRGFAGGSQALANQIKGKLHRADVFISASPTADASLTGTANGDWVRWYVQFAESPLVVGYNPQSRFAAAFKSQPWYEILSTPGIRVGHTDPALDPKGALTVAALSKAEQVYQRPGLMQTVLGKNVAVAQGMPEEGLVGRLQSGQLDAGFFYSTETTDAKIPNIPLPPEVSQHASYTITIPRDAPDPQGAARFVAFLLGPDGQTILKAHGLDVDAPKLTGAAGEVPASVKPLLAP